LQEPRELKSQLELSVRLPLIAQRAQQHREVAPSLQHLVLQELVLASLLPALALQALLQLRERLVVIELAQQLRVKLQLVLAVLEQELQREQQLQVQELVLKLQERKKYLVQQLVLVLVGRRHLVLQLAYPHLRPLVDCSGSRSPTLQERKIDLLDIARTSLPRANHLHRNLVLKTLSAPLRS
jgi:hypothetical protein